MRLQGNRVLSEADVLRHRGVFDLGLKRIVNKSVERSVKSQFAQREMAQLSDGPQDLVEQNRFELCPVAILQNPNTPLSLFDLSKFLLQPPRAFFPKPEYVLIPQDRQVQNLEPQLVFCEI